MTDKEKLELDYMADILAQRVFNHFTESTERDNLKQLLKEFAELILSIADKEASRYGGRI